MKKRTMTTKIIAGVTAFLLVGGLLFVANGLVGNPVSKIMANQNAKKHIENNFNDLNLELDTAYYSFKDGDYHVPVQSKTSIDTHFDVKVSPYGEVLSTTYSDNVVSGFNTWRRINDGYRQMVDSVLQKEDFPYESDIDFGEIPLLYKDLDSFGPAFGVLLTDLTLDENYDLHRLGREMGRIIFYTYDPDVSAKRAGEILLDLKDIFDQQEIPFYAIDFTLSEPKDEKINPREQDYFSVNGFLYEEIYEEDLTSRLKMAADELSEFNDQQDFKK